MLIWGNVLDRSQLRTQKLLRQKHRCAYVEAIQKVYGHHCEMVDRYYISIFQTSMDLFHLHRLLSVTGLYFSRIWLWAKTWLYCKKQKLLSPSEQLVSPLDFGGICFANSFRFCVLFCLLSCLFSFYCPFNFYVMYLFCKIVTFIIYLLVSSEKELLKFEVGVAPVPEHLCSLPVFSWVDIDRSLVFM